MRLESQGDCRNLFRDSQDSEPEAQERRGDYKVDVVGKGQWKVRRRKRISSYLILSSKKEFKPEAV